MSWWGSSWYSTKVYTSNISDKVGLCFDQRSIWQGRTVTSHLPFHTHHSNLYHGQYFGIRCTHVWHTLTYTFKDTCLHTADQSCQGLFRSSLCPLSLTPHPYQCYEGVCVCVCVSNRYSLSVRVATKCSDISVCFHKALWSLLSPCHPSVPPLPPLPLPVNKCITSYYV